MKKKIKRFYKLTSDGILAEYKKKEDKEPKHSYKGFVGVQMASSASGFGFRLTHDETRTHRFYADSKEGRETWIQKLKPFLIPADATEHVVVFDSAPFGLHFQVSETKDPFVSFVDPQGKGAESGILMGDVVVKLNDIVVPAQESIQDFTKLVTSINPPLTMTVRRCRITKCSFEQGTLGIRFVLKRGVLVISNVEEGLQAHKAGVAVGDVIILLNDQPFPLPESANSFSSHIKSLPRPFSFTFKRQWPIRLDINTTLGALSRTTSASSASSEGDYQTSESDFSAAEEPPAGDDNSKETPPDSSSSEKPKADLSVKKEETNVDTTSDSNAKKEEQTKAFNNTAPQEPTASTPTATTTEVPTAIATAATTEPTQAPNEPKQTEPTSTIKEETTSKSESVALGAFEGKVQSSGSSYVLYSFEVTSPKEKHSCGHRYSEFHRLRSSLVDIDGSVAKISFPSKTLLRSQSLSASVIEARKEGLHAWLSSVVELASTKDTEQVKRFLDQGQV